MPILPWMKMSISGERCVEPGSACVAPASIIFLICSAPDEVLRGVDRDLGRVAERAAAAPEPHGRLGLCLFGAERHAVAGDAAAERRHLGRGIEQLVPGRRCLDAGLLEQRVVDEQGTGRRDQRQRVGGAVDLGVLEERRPGSPSRCRPRRRPSPGRAARRRRTRRTGRRCRCPVPRRPGSWWRRPSRGCPRTAPRA